MRLLFLVRSIDPSRGGIERNTNTLFRYFESHGMECFCIYAEIPVLDSDVITAEKRMWLDMTSGRRRLAGQCIEYIRKNKIDIILNRGIYFSFLTDVFEQLKKAGDCRIIHSLHSSPEDLNYEGRIFNVRFKKLYHNLPFLHNRIYKRRCMYHACDRFVLLSPRYIEEAYKEFRLPDREKLVSIANPRPYDEIDYDRIFPKKKQVLIVSRLDNAQKNLKSAFRIWKKVEERGTDGWELVLAGHGENERSLLRYAGRLGLRSFRFVGRSDTPLSLYQESAIFIMTSHFEGFPTTLQESLQNGCVPMAFDTFSALHDMIADGHDGIVIRPGDEDAYADALYSLICDEERRTEMAKAGMRSCDRFNVENIGRQWLELFESL